MTETEVQVESTSILPEEKKDQEPRSEEQKEQKPRSPRGGRRQGDKEDGMNEGNLEREFKNFALKLRKQFGEDGLAYQISHHPGGLEFSVRVAKKSGGGGARFTRSFAANFSGNKRTEKKELTEEQKARRAEKQAKRREYFEKKKQERLENCEKEDKDGGKEEPAADGPAAKHSQ